jgi:hypothetical protein
LLRFSFLSSCLTQCGARIVVASSCQLGQHKLSLMSHRICGLLCTLDTEACGLSCTLPEIGLEGWVQRNLDALKFEASSLQTVADSLVLLVASFLPAHPMIDSHSKHMLCQKHYILRKQHVPAGRARRMRLSYTCVCQCVCVCGVCHDV